VNLNVWVFLGKGGVVILMSAVGMVDKSSSTLVALYIQLRWKSQWSIWLRSVLVPFNVNECRRKLSGPQEVIGADGSIIRGEVVLGQVVGGVVSLLLSSDSCWCC